MMASNYNDLWQDIQDDKAPHDAGSEVAFMRDGKLIIGEIRSSHQGTYRITRPGERQHWIIPYNHVMQVPDLIAAVRKL